MSKTQEEKLDFNVWRESHDVELEEKYINLNVEEFPTDDSMVEIADNSGFWDFCEAEYDDYLAGHRD